MESTPPAKGQRRKLKRVMQKTKKPKLNLNSSASASVVYYKKVKAALNASCKSMLHAHVYTPVDTCMGVLMSKSRDVVMYRLHSTGLPKKLNLCIFNNSCTRSRTSNIPSRLSLCVYKLCFKMHSKE